MEIEIMTDIPGLADKLEKEIKERFDVPITKTDTKPKPEKKCDFCSKPTPMADLNDITSCGDWWTVCTACKKKFN